MDDVGHLKRELAGAYRMYASAVQGRAERIAEIELIWESLLEKVDRGAGTYSSRESNLIKIQSARRIHEKYLEKAEKLERES